MMSRIQLQSYSKNPLFRNNQAEELENRKQSNRIKLKSRICGRKVGERERNERKTLPCNLWAFQMLIKKNLFSLVKVILSDLLPAEKHNKLPPDNVNM